MDFRVMRILLFFSLLFPMFSECRAALPSSVYESEIIKSKIKVIGIVTDISSVRKGKHFETKKLSIEIITVIKPKKNVADTEGSLFFPKHDMSIAQNEESGAETIKAQVFKPGDIVSGMYSTLPAWNWPWASTPPPGGTICFYPELGDRVFATISSNDGSLTSYTKTTPKLEEALMNNQSALKLGNHDVVFINALPKAAEHANGSISKLKSTFLAISALIIFFLIVFYLKKRTA